MTDRLPGWMDRHYLRLAFVFTIMMMVMLLCMGWALHTIQQRLIQSSGHTLVQAATDAASKLDKLI